ncbi:helix-turn-helix transcriptional regulator [Dactylosporangium sp. CA-233914]|uniref:helix-turn-helix transcriptional regulator n=1 Tax=Dactylosporangium sp. CA-233914 TaxID=3239934 RepID=UPI003D90C6AB
MQDHWAALTALADPTRRALYDYVQHQDHPVSREEAADAQRMSRGLAAFHMDKLVDAGLLCARYEASADQPRGRGRTPKVYEPATDGLAITVPERRYELIAEILADAVADDPANAGAAARRRAHSTGREIGTRFASGRVDLIAALSGLGFEPQPAPAGRVLLHNCPFHALAARQTALVCGLSHTLLAGLLEGLGATDLEARLAPRPGACCVELVPATTG